MSNYIAVPTDKIDIKQINKKLAINLLALSNSDNIHEALDEWIGINLGRKEGENEFDFEERKHSHLHTFIIQENGKYRCLCGGSAIKIKCFFNINKDNDNTIVVANGNHKTSCIRYFNNYKRIKVSDATPEELKKYTKELKKYTGKLQKFNHSQLMSHWGFNKLSFIHSKILLKEDIYFNIPYVNEEQYYFDTEKFKYQFGGELNYSINKYYLNYNTKLDPIKFKKLLGLYDLCE